MAHNGSGFDGYVVLKNLLQSRNVNKLIKNGSGNISRKIFDGCVIENKKIPQNVHLRCGRVHVNNSLKKISLYIKITTKFT